MGPTARRRLLFGVAVVALGASGVELLGSKPLVGPPPDRAAGPSVEANDRQRSAELAVPERRASGGDHGETAVEGDAVDDDAAQRESAVASAPHPSATLVVRLLDPEGRPIEDIHPLRVWVSVKGIPRGSIPRCGPPEDPPPRESESRLTEIPAGPQVAEVSVPGYLPATAPFVAVADSETVVVIRLDAGVRFGGIVADEAGHSVESATVTVLSAESRWKSLSTVTDADGRFEVTGITPGEWFAEATHGAAEGPSFRATKEPLRFEGPTRDARLVLSGWGWISLAVVTPARSVARPLGLTMSSDSRHPPKLHVDDDGRLLIGPFQAGEHTWSLMFEGYAPIRRTVETRWSETTNLGKLVLDSGIAWDGRVVDLDGGPIAGARIDLHEDDVAALTSDSEGKFHFANLPRSQVVASVSGPEFVSTTHVIDFAKSGGPERIVLRSGGVVRGRVSLADSPTADYPEVLADRLLPTVRADGCPNSETAGIETDGTFELRLAPGRWRLSLVLGGHRKTALGDWTVTEGESKDVGLLAPLK